MQYPTATELAMIAAQQRRPFDPKQPDTIPNRVDLIAEAHNAFELWDACHSFLEHHKQRDIPSEHLPLDEALRTAGFTGQTAAKRESQFCDLLTNEPARELLSFGEPVRTAEKILSEIKEKGLAGRYVKLLATFREEQIKALRQKAGKARQARKTRKR